MENILNQMIDLYNNSNVICLFDTETTGLSSEKERIIEIGAKKIRLTNNGFEELDSLEIYIKPPIKKTLSEKIIELTGITNEFLADMDIEEDCFPVIYKFFEDVDCIGAYNIPFDMGFMKALYQRNGKEFVITNTFDVLVFARTLISKSECNSHKLSSIAEYLNVNEDIQFHNAIDDVEATCRVFRKLLDIANTEYMKMLKIDKIHATYINCAFWKGFKGNSRIYINTNIGSIYYDVRSKTYGGKDVELNSIYLSELLENVFISENVKDINELVAKYK